ncbi:MAG: transcriptional repressor [Solirubrobacteraceae bacterium]|jgi:Fur family ferric uptake transcriptional regulator|nr:transcriptional repressor [Solirubrobacteraceae bacterium]MCU0312897.1 transcriptional repressor [Solirubrobacteraceae bacterium]
MAPTGHTHEAWAESAAEALSRAGYRRGGARAAVLEQLDAQACALTAYEIEAALRGRGRAVGRASVYRVLEELHELGVVTKVELGQGQARYEPNRAEHHHHHLVCDRCGAVVPFDDEPLERAIAAISRKVDFEVSEHEIVLHGACADCRA